MPTSFDLRFTPSIQPVEADVDEPEVEQLLDVGADEVTFSGSSIDSPLQTARKSQVFSPLKLPNPDIATPRAPTSRFRGKVTKLVQAFEVRSTCSDRSISSSPLKTSRQQADAPVSRITPRQPSHRPSLSVKKSGDGRLLEQMGDTDALDKQMDFVDLDTGVPTSREQEISKSISLHAEMIASTVGSLGDPERTTSSFGSFASYSSPARRTHVGGSRHEHSDPQDVLMLSDASQCSIASPLVSTSQAAIEGGIANSHRISAYSPCSITSATPRSAMDSIVNCVRDEGVQNTNDVFPLPAIGPQNELPEVSIESEKEEMISANLKIAGVVQKSLVAYSISSCSRSVSPCSVSQGHPHRDRCKYPDQYFLPVYPTKFITHIQDGHVGLAIMFPDPGGIFRKATDACKAVGSSTKAAFGEASKLAQTSIGKSALTGAALLSVAGGGSGAVAGSGVGAMIGMFMAPLSFGLSIPVGACIGCGAGVCMGVTAGGAVGAASGGALAYAFQGKHEDTDTVFVGPFDPYVHVIQNSRKC